MPPTAAHISSGAALSSSSRCFRKCRCTCLTAFGVADGSSTGRHCCRRFSGVALRLRLRLLRLALRLDERLLLLFLLLVLRDLLRRLRSKI